LAYPKGTVPISNEAIDAKSSKGQFHTKGMSEEEKAKFDVAVFMPTPYISTYLFAVICGPFKGWDAK